MAILIAPLEIRAETRSPGQVLIRACLWMREEDT